MRILIVGDMRVGSNSRGVAGGYERAGADVRTIDTSWVFDVKRGSSTWQSMRRDRTAGVQANDRLRREMREATEGFRPDILLAIKTIYFDQSILLQSAAQVKLHLSFDDVSNNDNLSSHYLTSESQWDLILTTKRHNLPEIKARGGAPHFIWGAFDPSFRKRTKSFDARPYDLGFIGAARPDRRALPRQLAESGLPNVVVVGPRWRRFYPAGVRGVEMRKPAMGDAYTSIANDIKTGLVLLNSENRDLHTNRSIETAAVGQLVLAEDTAEHRELYEDGREALLFSDLELGLRRLKELNRAPGALEHIAENGYRRVVKGGFTYADRAREVMSLFGSLS